MPSGPHGVFARSRSSLIITTRNMNTIQSGSNPRYHARQVAQRRVGEHGAKLVMGSATPSMEAFLMMEEGKVVRHLLPRRVAGGGEPQVTVVNMLTEQRMLSRTLVTRMKATLDAGRQVILFLNRRGFSYFFHCRSCGFEMVCPHCSVAMTYHKDKDRMVCHYCGNSRTPMEVCPECHSVDVGYGGFGTEMVEQEVSRMFPDARIARLDTDSARKSRCDDVLNEFREEHRYPARTQMVAKGLNFPKVDWWGSCWRQCTHLPIRLPERTFNLSPGERRAGRYSERRVVVQTFHPDNNAIRMATGGDPEEFYRQELAARKESAFPPYTRLVNFVIRGRSKEKCAQGIESLRLMVGSCIEGLKDVCTDPLDVPDILGTAPCPIEKIAGNWRYHLVLRGYRIARVLQIASTVHQQFKVSSGLYLEIDVDPLHLL